MALMNNFCFGAGDVYDEPTCLALWPYDLYVTGAFLSFITLTDHKYKVSLSSINSHAHHYVDMFSFQLSYITLSVSEIVVIVVHLSRSRYLLLLFRDSCSLLNG
jgi:hypothetical protein